MTLTARYHIWCRTEEVSLGKHLVTVYAVPVPAVEGGEVASESRLFVSRQLAEIEGERITATMSRRLLAAGHTVERVTVLAGPVSRSPAGPRITD